MYLLIVFFLVLLVFVREVCEGFIMDVFIQCLEVYLENSCFFIIYGEEFFMFDLVF